MKLYISIALIMLSFCLSAQQERQNFVFILVDDLGWTDLGYMGSDFHESPNIDSLSKHSLVFDNAYSSSSVCSPSRAAIMAGQHPARVDITDWIPGRDPKHYSLLGPQDKNELPLEQYTIAEVLREEGYSTFFAGKWHLGGDGFLPDDQGFNTNIGGNHTGQPKGGYYAPYDNPQLPDGEEGEYLTDRLTQESIAYLQSIEEKPFCLFLNYYTVHTPIQPSKRRVAKFEKKLERLNVEPLYEINADSKTNLKQQSPNYASMVYALDENIGQLLKALKDNGLYDNTTIIFTSDNGSLTTLLAKYDYPIPTAVLPLRAGKGWLYEGGIRVPLLIKPAFYKGGQRWINEPVVGHDFFPTILSLANAEKPQELTLDGQDLSVLMDENGVLDREFIYWHYPHYHGSGWRPGAAIRQGDWKLILFYESNTVELYNLAEDISERNDISALYPDKVDFLKSNLIKLQDAMDAKRPVPNEAYEQKD